MSENRNPLDSLKKDKAFRRLADDLADFDRQDPSIPPGDSEMLSLVINDALNGVDITKRYPTFYKKILSNPSLRLAFIDSLEVIEKSRETGLFDLPNASKPDLSFLNNLSSRPSALAIKKSERKIQWKKTIEQLQMIFFPAGLGLTYRHDPSLFDDAWFTLIRENINLTGTSYSILLECGISENMENSLSAFLSIAVVFETATASYQFPVSVTLHWGNYNETIKIVDQGRERFPDIPFTQAFDGNLQNIISEMNLTIEKDP